LFIIGKRAGFKKIESFKEEVIDPFTRNEVLISKSFPYCTPEGKFIRRPEPFYPSVPMLLLAEIG